MGGSASSLLDENKSKYIKGKKKLNNRESLRLKFWYALGERRNEGAAHSSARFIEHEEIGLFLSGLERRFTSLCLESRRLKLLVCA